MRIFLTGSTGILGSRLSTLINKNPNMNLTEILRSDFESTAYVDLLNSNDTISQELPEVLIHAAWPVANRDYRNSPDNERFAQTTIELFSKFKDVYPDGFILGIGTFLEFGTKNSISDYSTCEPEDRYSEAKVHVYDWMRTNLVGNFSWARIATMVSGKDPYFKLTTQILKEQSFELLRPQSSQDFIHAEDAANAIYRISTERMAGATLVATGRTLTNSTYANAINYALGRQQLMVDEEQKKDLLETNPEKLQMLGWNPQFVNKVNLAKKIVEEFMK